MRIAAEPFLTSMQIACAVLGILLAVFLVGSIGGLACCTGDEESIGFDEDD